MLMDIHKPRFVKNGKSGISEIYIDDMKRIIYIYCGKVMKVHTKNGYNKDFICGGGVRMVRNFCPTVANNDKVFLMTNICGIVKGYEPMKLDLTVLRVSDIKKKRTA